MKSVIRACVAAAVVQAVTASLLCSGVAVGEEKGDKKAEPQTVKKILKVEHSEQEINPPNLVVKAVGEVSTGGYTNAKLTRTVYVTPPKDGIQDYTLTADAPTGPAIQVISKVDASDTWKGYAIEAPWVKGVRVHGVDKGVVVVMFAKAK